MSDEQEPTIKDLFRVMNDMRGGVDGLRDEVGELRGELRAAKNDLGEQIDAINARSTADKASTDEQLNSIRQEVSQLRQDQNGIRQDISRLATTTKATLDSHTARFRTVDGKLDALKDQGKAIIARLDSARVPAH